MTDQRTFSFVKPSLNTPFHIDFDWWKEHDSNWRVFLANCLCPDHSKVFSDNPNTEVTIDWVDPETAEIKQVDGLLSIIMDHCAKEEGYFANQTLVNAVFRVFLSNGNSPLSSIELSDKIDKQAETILRTLSSVTVYKGLRPCR